MHPEFEAVIGLEVHCQLSTDSKIFCGCRARVTDKKSVSEVDSNSNTCPICAGHPGTLPVLNRKVIEFAMKAGLATHCKINPKNSFARKNYFYPDLPKGYQITQFDHPICEKGWINIETKLGSKKIGLQRIHIEEDAGKNIHMSGFSLVNLNRAGVPLIEIVSEPDMRTAEEAGAYLRALHAVVTYLEICDGNMQEGNFRCDANVSVMPIGSKTFGTRAEIKNVNSFRFIEKAIDYEIARQIELIRSGKKVIQETRGYDSAKNETFSMRSKEEAQDYRYFTEPDLITVQIDSAWIEATRNSLPELPEEKRLRLIQEFGLSAYDAGVLTSSKPLVQFFDEVIQISQKAGQDGKGVAKPAANWLTGEVARLLNEEAIEINQSQLKAEHIADLIRLIQDQTLSSTGAKQVLSILWKTGESVATVVEREGLKQVSNLQELEPIIDKVIQSFPNQAAQFRSGKDKLLGFFVGQAMKETGGKANPGLLGEIFKKKLLSS